MEDRYIACMDLGTSKIALTVAKVDKENVQVLYYDETPSEGIHYSCVFNPGKASECVSRALKQAEDELKIKILQVVIGLPRYGVRQEKAPGQLERTQPGSCITQEEVDTLKNLAMEDFPLEDDTKEKVFEAVAQSFSTEDLIRMPERDIVGAISRSLEGNFTIFIGRKTDVNNLEAVFQRAGIAVARNFFTPDVTADAVLTREERENGVALIDLGAGVSSVTIYQGGILRHYGAIPFGGRSITADIQYECAFNESLAENIKLAFGACQPEKLLSMSEKIIQISNDEDGSNRQLSVKYLSEIITAREREIFSALLYEIQRSGYAERLRNGVVFTGGASQLANCTNLFKEMSGYDVRVAFPRQKHFVAESCPNILDTTATSSVGLLLRARKDDHLNCIDKPSEPVKEEEEPVDLKGTVFGDTGNETIKEKKPARKAAAAKRPKVTFLKKFTDSVLGLYDNVNETAE